MLFERSYAYVSILNSSFTFSSKSIHHQNVQCCIFCGIIQDSEKCTAGIELQTKPVRPIESKNDALCMQ